MTEEKRVKVHLTYRYQEPGRKKGQVFNVFEHYPDGSEVVLDRKSKSMRGSALSSPSPGMVFEVDAEPPGDGKELPSRFYTGTARYVYRVEDERVDQWAAVETANKGLVKAAERLKRESQRDPLLESLEPLRDAYKRMTGPQKAQFIAAVVRKISG